MMLSDMQKMGKLEKFLPADLDLFRKIYKAQCEKDIDTHEALLNQLTEQQIKDFIRYKDTIVNSDELLQATPSMTTAYTAVTRANGAQDGPPSSEPEQGHDRKKRRKCDLL